MVKIAIAGGSGRVARGIIDALVATKKHEIQILTRGETATPGDIPGVTWVKTDYNDKKSLTTILDGVHTLLSFVGGVQDPGSILQKNLIGAAIAAGVQRYAPSEWSSSSIEELPWYAEKGAIREYLKEINKEKKAKYCLFQPGLFVDYWAPADTSTMGTTQELWIDFNKRRAIDIEGKEGIFSLTTMGDLANVVAQAIDYPGEWPVIGGVHGVTTSSSKVLEIGARVQNGKPFDITFLKEEDVRADNIKSPWIPKFENPSLTAEQVEYFSKLILKGSLLSGLTRSWVVSDDWNRLLPDYKFTSAEEFLEKSWAGRA
ncbi:hypothetical protein BP6252_07338 [Coleophoma cylindrospora]|uniref:NmrA-like domain-containing protein n=1 Tax=Coleophoma cylindrospora TaxID=1849047 RepID=A0A3D8RHV9_9HELO|nr:hypothetical protein BP6252_07338 [Coleophoma cylindrospora]